MPFDLFICHSSEDKNDFVRPLAEALKREHVEVWYDEFSLLLGDNIRRSINLGLSQARFGVVILSPAFFNKRWSQYELDGLIEREISANDKIILPIWHDISHKEIVGHSPSLASREAVLSSEGIEKVVKEVLNVIHPQGGPLIQARDNLIKWCCHHQ